MRDKRTPKDVCGEARSLRDAAFVSTHIVYMYQPHGCWFIELNAGVMQFSSLFFLSFFLSLILSFFLSFFVFLFFFYGNTSKHSHFKDDVVQFQFRFTTSIWHTGLQTFAGMIH